MSERFVFHVDVNSAFLSWSAVKRLGEGDTVDLRLIPSAVGGDRKTRHGVITAKSIPAKTYGVTTGEPVVKALQKCPKLVLVPGDYAWYETCSHAFKQVCEEFSPIVESFSIDECFMDLTGFLDANTRECAVATAYRLKDTIRERLGFTVNVGVSENKTLAKMASDFQKPDRVHTLFPDEIETKMWPLPVGDLLFVGRRTVPVLEKLGIRTIGELAHYPTEVLRYHVGEKAAYGMSERANGIDPSPVTMEVPEEKSYSHSITMPHDVTTEEEAREVLRHLSDRVAERLRADSAKAGLVSVQYKSADFRMSGRQRKLDYITCSSDFLYEEAARLFSELWDYRTPIRLLGVTAGQVTRESFEQMDLFRQKEKEKHEKLDSMLDDLHARFGRDSVKRMSDLKKDKKN